MKKKISTVIAVAAISLPMIINAAEMVKVNNATQLKRIPVKVSKVSCPSGWSKVLDISATKSKWSENSPVVTCKPNSGQVMDCPSGTYFYVKGNEFQDGYSNGAIGCHTPVM